MKAATLTVLAMLSAVPLVGIAAQPAEGNSDHQQMLAKLREIERAVWIQTKSEALCCSVTMAQGHAIMEIGEAGE
jgi:hypothetical protein